MDDKRMGPPTPGPLVHVSGRDVDVMLRVNGPDDAEIVRLAMDMCERRRYAAASIGKAGGEG